MMKMKHKIKSKTKTKLDERKKMKLKPRLTSPINTSSSYSWNILFPLDHF